MKKSTLIMVLSLVLAVAIGIGSTMAYLQDTDEDVNVMTLGSVYIEQHEFERVPTENGYSIIETERGDSYELQEYTQGKPLYPAVINGDGPQWDTTKVYNAQFGDGHYYGAMDVFGNVSNAQDKFVYVENTGKSDAYVRTIIAYEVGALSETEFDELIGISLNSFWKKNHVGIVNIDDNNYYVVEYLYDGNQYPEKGQMVEAANGRHPDGIVHPGEWTYNSLAQIYMMPEATNETMEAIDGNKNGTYDILVVSQAVQTQGFADAKTALNEAFGPITADNHPWLGEAPNDAPTSAVAIDNVNDLFENLGEVDIIYTASGTESIYESEEAITVDGNDTTVVLKGDGRNTGWFAYLGFVPPAGEGVAVSNLNVTGSGFVELGHYGNGGGTYTAENLVIEDLVATLDSKDGANHVACAFSQYGNATLTNCVMKGTTAAESAAEAYDAGFVHGTTTYINGGEYGKLYLWSQAHVTIKDAEVDVIDSTAITTKNYGMLTIGAGTHVGTINLIPPGTYPHALTIEEGATVDAIVYQGVTYTQAEWLAR